MSLDDEFLSEIDTNLSNLKETDFDLRDLNRTTSPIEDFFETKELKSHHLVQNYRSALRPWLQFVLNAKDEDDVVALWEGYARRTEKNPELIFKGLQQYFLKLRRPGQNDTPLQPSYIKYRRELLLSFLGDMDVEFSKRQQKMIKELMPDSRTLENQTPEPWELRRILSPMPLEPKLFYLLQKSTGARPIEVWFIRWKDILNLKEITGGSS